MYTYAYSYTIYINGTTIFQVNSVIEHMFVNVRRLEHAISVLWSNKNYNWIKMVYWHFLGHELEMLF